MTTHSDNRPPVELHRLISAVIRDPALAEQLRASSRTVYERFGVPPEQQAQLDADPVAALSALGVHGNLQFKYLGARGLLTLAPASIRPYLDTLEVDSGKTR